MISEQAVVGPDAVGPGFLDDVVALPEGDTIYRCMQCGTCSASCPLGDVLEYGPRQIILKARCGAIGDVLASPSVWMCVGCYTCSSRCPRGIDLTDTDLARGA
jgi:heterodisulfide reductase subunit C